MSYNIDGKVVNQSYSLSPNEFALCGKCTKLIPAPKSATLAEVSGKSIYEINSYLGTKHYIYETKSGTAVVYCSDYCRRKHNHRFNK